MIKKKFIIDGNNFSDLDGFYDEIRRVLTDNFEGFGRNLDALDDVLEGGFGKFDEYENIILIWKNFDKSKKELKPEILKKLVEILKYHKNIEFKIEK